MRSRRDAGARRERVRQLVERGRSGPHCCGGVSRRLPGHGIDGAGDPVRESSEELAPRGIIDAASSRPAVSSGEAINDYYNPKPPRPGAVEIKRYNNGNPAAAGSWQSANADNQYTNWDQSLLDTAVAAGGGPGDLVVYITDGDPTAYDFNRSGRPVRAGPPSDVGVGTDRNSDGRRSYPGSRGRAGEPGEAGGRPGARAGRRRRAAEPVSVDRLDPDVRAGRGARP